MTTHAELAATLLREAASMFRTVGASNAEMRPKGDQLALAYEHAAELVELDPMGSIELAPGSPA